MIFSESCSFPLGHEFKKGYICDIGIGKLEFQDDGNLVVYDCNRKARWSSRSVSSGVRAFFQSDGNLVVYDAGGRPIWNSGTHGRGKSLIFQSDRNFVIYDGNGRPVWNANTHN
jgi:hypothetical protein